MSSDVIRNNLAVVDLHLRDEARDPATVMSLYSDGIVLEMPSRGLSLAGKTAIEANYRRMFGAIRVLGFEPIDRFATETRVVDDCRVRFEIIGEGFDNAPYPIGARVELRLLHVFEMVDGKIDREKVFEGWSRID